MLSFHIPENKKVRVILSTDAKNEVDDPFAIVHAVLTESFDLRGILSAHFGTERTDRSEEESFQEIHKLLKLMNRQDQIPVVHGAASAMSSDPGAPVSDAARFLVQEALREDDRPLYAAFLGPLTDLAEAIRLEPRIQNRLTAIWIGGGNWPSGGWEYNLKNDVTAADAVFRSSVPLWQIPRNVYRMMPVTFAELCRRVRPWGPLGQYLYENVVNFNNADPGRPTEYRILGDSPAVGVILYSDCGQWKWQPAPEFDHTMHYLHTGKNRPIRVYETMDSRFILEDFYAKLELYPPAHTGSGKYFPPFSAKAPGSSASAPFWIPLSSALHPAYRNNQREYRNIHSFPACRSPKAPQQLRHLPFASEGSSPAEPGLPLPPAFFSEKILPNLPQ